MRWFLFYRLIIHCNIQSVCVHYRLLCVDDPGLTIRHKVISKQIYKCYKAVSVYFMKKYFRKNVAITQ